MTFATCITFSRLLLLPVFCLLVFCYAPEREWYRFAALGLFILMALSDAVDGYVARRFNQHSRLGAMLDPIADKLVVNFALIFLALNQRFAPPVPLWFPVYVLARDLLIVLGALALLRQRETLRVAPSMAGKATTALLMVTIIAALLAAPFLAWTIWAAVAMSVVSLLQYARFAYARTTGRRAA